MIEYLTTQPWQFWMGFSIALNASLLGNILYLIATYPRKDKKLNQEKK